MRVGCGFASGMSRFLSAFNDTRLVGGRAAVNHFQRCSSLFFPLCLLFHSCWFKCGILSLELSIRTKCVHVSVSCVHTREYIHLGMLSVCVCEPAHWCLYVMEVFGSGETDRVPVSEAMV